MHAPPSEADGGHHPGRYVEGPWGEWIALGVNTPVMDERAWQTGKGLPPMTIAIAQPARTGNPGIVPPWLQGPRPVTPAPAIPGAPAPAPQPEVPTAATRDALVAVPLSNGDIVIVDVPNGMFPGGDHGHDHTAPTSRRGFGAASDARRGVDVAAEQQRVDGLVRDIQAKYADLGIRPDEGNDPVKAFFLPSFPNAAYAPEGFRDAKLGVDMPADSIGVGVDPRSGRSFAEAGDVVAHELAHRIIDNMTPSKLSMHPMSEDVAVHESLADTFASLVDRDDWVLGEQLVQPVRVMDKPEQLGHPGHVDDLKTVLAPGSKHMVPVGRDRRTGEVVTAPDWHVVAGIPNKAAAIIGDELGRDKLGEIYLKAVREGVRPGQEVEGLAVAVLQSAKDLYGTDSREFQVTQAAWDAVGVLDLLKQ